MKNYIKSKDGEMKLNIILKKEQKPRENRMELQEIYDEIKNNIESFFATDK